MIKHIVMFKLADKTPENVRKAVQALKNLEGTIETLKFLEVGLDFKQSERSYDIILTTHFDNKEGLQAYATHENHLPVIDTMRALCASSIVVDYQAD